MQLQALGYSPSTSKVGGDKKVAPKRIVCVLNCGLPAYSWGQLTRPPLSGSGSQPTARKIGAAVLTRQEKHTPSSYRCCYPTLSNRGKRASKANVDSEKKRKGILAIMAKVSSGSRGGGPEC